MPFTHRSRVETMLADAAARHAQMLPELPPAVRDSLPADAQGLTEAIDFLGEAAGLSTAERRGLIRPHGINPAVMHARVFGGTTPLGEGTVMGAFVEGARVRAGVLVELAEAIGGAPLSAEVRELLVEHPLPLAGDGLAAAPALRAAYAAQEDAAIRIATALDDAAA
jgi:hypothetical protein